MVEKTEREKAQTNIAENRKAFHDYHLLESFEAGIVLLGTEVKAIREGRVNLRDSFARIENGEVYLYNVNISPYSHRGYADHEPMRRRKLLLNRNEILKLVGKTVEKGMTLVPVRMYFKNGRVKVAVSLAKGKKDYDKRETIKRRETERETRAAIKERLTATRLVTWAKTSTGSATLLVWRHSRIGRDPPFIRHADAGWRWLFWRRRSATGGRGTSTPQHVVQRPARPPSFRALQIPGSAFGRSDSSC